MVDPLLLVSFRIRYPVDRCSRLQNLFMKVVSESTILPSSINEFELYSFLLSSIKCHNCFAILRVSYLKFKLFWIARRQTGGLGIYYKISYKFGPIWTNVSKKEKKKALNDLNILKFNSHLASSSQNSNLINLQLNAHNYCFLGLNILYEVLLP